MQVCISLQTDNHASTTPLNFLQAGCPSCRPTNSVKALKELILRNTSNTKTAVAETTSCCVGPHVRKDDCPSYRTPIKRCAA